MTLEDAKKDPQTLAVSDLQLFIAFYMRQGLDLTEKLREDGGRYHIQYDGAGALGQRLAIEAGVSINAEFDADGRLVKLHHTKTHADEQG